MSELKLRPPEEKNYGTDLKIGHYKRQLNGEV